ncbi:flippase [Acidihalobacter prosperus]|uniref:Polysaccharide biosynthesis protein C-terminal domain-containing protein n=1 Tax=Acidihalobacter prosperus TaxID=160660 RepID=A0A1A6C611_9GAMM|nr:flippase [Acidihalobacter prosperus]OBS09999.1 hypothetical protein Thpro_021049 [Acidihalobacter prosperus]
MALPISSIFSSDMNTPSVLRSTTINLIGQLVPTVVSLATVPLYLHWVGEVKYGILLLAFTILGYFGAFDFGLGRAVAQRVAGQEDDAANNRTFWTAAVFGLVIGVLGGFILLVLGHLFFSGLFRIPAQYQEQAVAAIPWLAASVPLVSALSILGGALQAKHAFISLNIGQSMGMVALQVFPLIGVAMGYATIPALVASALLGRLVGVAYLYWSVSRELPFVGLPRIDRREVGPLLRFGSWISLSSVLIPLLTIVDRMVIGARIGAGAVTVYTIPFSLTQRVAYLPLSLATTLFPRFSQLDDEESRKLLHQGVIGLTALLTPLVVLGLLGMRPFFDFWLGADMAIKTVPVAIIILLSVWLNGPAYVPNIYMPAKNRPDLMSKFYLVELLPFLVVLWVMVGLWGVIGAAVAWIMRSAADALFCFLMTGTHGVYWRASRWNMVAVALAVWVGGLSLPFMERMLWSIICVVLSCVTAWLCLTDEMKLGIVGRVAKIKRGVGG